MSAIVIIIIAALAVILALGLAYVPMRLLLGHMARHMVEFIQRQRERRTVARDTPDRRKAEPAVDGKA
jgi:flagellar basal body-associated protein FliL